MTGVNAVVLLGHLTRDPELRYTPTGAAVAQFGLGVNRRWRDAQGGLQESACFVEIVAWGRQAETVTAHLTKGRGVVVEGRLELDRWETDAGERRSRHKVVAQRVTFLGRNGAGESSPDLAAEGVADGAEEAVPAWVSEGA